MKKASFFIILIFILFFSFGVKADSISQRQVFNIDPSYDLQGRDKVNAVLVKITSSLYFYVDENWWNSSNQENISNYLTDLGLEFENSIYPNLTSIFGSELKPGIDKDYKITVLIHPMANNAGGYFRSNDEYPKIQIANSNEREMIYLNSEFISNSLAKSFLAHEFMHLITFNQKENRIGRAEEVWLNEARAEYAPTVLGYDDNYEGSNLQKRVEIFSANPSDSIINWSGSKSDYGVVNIFTQYLADHYGINILRDSLKSDKVGIESLNLALKKNSFSKNIDQVFFDWTIAVLVNDCALGQEYCFLNPNLKNLHITPKINFLPLGGESALTFADFTRKWSGNWYKIIGGNSNLKLSFTCRSGTNFKAPYIVQNLAGSYNINFLNLSDNCQSELKIENFNKDIKALFLIPSAADSSQDPTFYPFSWTVSIENNDRETALIENMLATINQLKAEISRVQARIAAILNKKIIPQPLPASDSCSQITVNLSLGMAGQQVSCLQNFLRSQGSNIYPEGLTTGYFGGLTKLAVIRFQEKYASEVLSPLGLVSATGYVGFSTRTKINELLK